MEVNALYERPGKIVLDFLAGDPDYVVRMALKGASKGKLHICPGIFSKLMWQAVRFVPIIGEQRAMREALISGQGLRP